MASDTDTSRASSPPLRDILGGLLFYIGIPAVTLYPLGFMALSLQIWRDPDFPYNWASSGFNFAMIWYAVSLVPKVVVIETGIRLLFVSLLSTTLSASIASLTLNLLRQWESFKSRPTRQRWGEIVSNETYHSSWERGFWYLSLLLLLLVVVLLVVSGFPFDSWYDAPFYAGYFLFSAVGGFILGYIRYKGHYRWTHHGIAFAFGGAIFAALCLSALQLPDLPYVEVEAAATWPDSLSGSPFRLLSGATSNYWYVYNQEQGILALDQTDVKSVRYWDETKRRTPKVNPGEDGLVNSD
jgi:hypothetical protein